MGNFNKGEKRGERGGKHFGARSEFGRGRPSSGGNQGNRGGRSSFGSDRGGSRSTGDRPDMHSATCSDCGRQCEVPFRPSGDKPVYCGNCFKSHGDSRVRDSHGGRTNGGARDTRPRYEEKRTYSNDAGKGAENYHTQFSILNAKLDRLIALLTPHNHSETKAVEEPTHTRFERAPKKSVDYTEVRKAVARAQGTKEEVHVPAPKKVNIQKKSAKKARTTKK